MKRFTQILFATLALLAIPIASHAQSFSMTMGGMNVCDNLTTLKTKIQVGSKVVTVLGQTTAFDGGGGVFLWDATNTLSTNYAILASTIGPTVGSASGGQWVWMHGTGYGKAPRTQALLATNQLLAEAVIVRLVSVTAATTNTATPFISATATGPISDGQYIEIIGTDDTLTVQVQDEGTLTGSKLQLGASTRTLGKGDVLKLRYNSADGYWYEEGFTNN